MKKILYKLLIFALLFWSGDKLFYWVFKSMIFDKTMSGESGGSVNYLLQTQRNADFLIMGTSRAKHQINPTLLTRFYAANGYNAGIDGVGEIIYNDVLLDLCLQKQLRPKALLLQLDSYQFTVKREESNKIISNILPLYPFYFDSPRLYEYVCEAGYAERLKLLSLRSYQFNGKLLNIVFNYLKQPTEKEFKGYAPHFTRMDSSHHQTATATKTAPPPLSPPCADALRHLLHTCAREQIALTILFPPSYQNTLLDTAANRQLMDIIRSQPQCRVLDWSDIRRFPDLQAPDLWKDPTHLNDWGAARLSQHLNDSLLTSLQ